MRIDEPRPNHDEPMTTQPRRIPIAEPDLAGRELEYLTECIRTGWISSKGEFVQRFERQFAAYCGASHGLATSSGTTALHLALAAAGIGPGDEVIVPSLTFVATANAAAYLGGRPVFVDCRADDWTIDPALVEERVTARTRAVVPVHLFGNPCDMDPIREIADRRGILVVEDAAQAVGAEYRGRRVGGLGDLSCFSFFANKVLTTGEGGMVTTASDAFADRARKLRDHGMRPERPYWHDEIGFNFRMTNLQAAVGVAQLERIERLIEARRSIVARYAERLGRLARVTLPRPAAWAKPSHWMVACLLDVAGEGERDRVIREMEADSIETRPFFHPLHTLPMYRTGDRMPASEGTASRGILLPTTATLTDADLDRIVESLRKAVERR